ncbi:MAG: MFS transporter [Pseudomonadota bacterium]
MNALRRFDVAIAAMALAVLVAGLAGISWHTVRSAETVLVPALDRKAQSVARSVAGLSALAVGYGIPVAQFVRAEEVLRESLDDNQDFAFAAILDVDGTVFAEVTREATGGYATAEADGITISTATIQTADEVHGSVVIGTPRTVAERLVRDVWIDVAILLLVAVLIAFELTAFAFTLPSAQLLRGLTQRLHALRRGDMRPHPQMATAGPMGAEIEAADAEINRVRAEHQALQAAADGCGDAGVQRDLKTLSRTHRLQETRDSPPVSLAAVRAPVFLFFFAEEMTRPFLPAFIANRADPDIGLSVELIVALPIIVFMAIVAISQPFLNGLSERVGRARSLRTGALIAAFGFLGTGFAETVADITAFRALTAVGLAVVFVSAQGFVVDRTGAGQRARGIGIFVSAIMAAMLCGPPIGGIVADRLGDMAAFTVSAGIAVVAYVCAWVALPRGEVARESGARAVRVSDIFRVLARPVMLALLVGTAMPAKMLLIGVCFYFIPLVLAQGFEPAAIGRVLMLYGLAMLIIVPAVSRWSDQARLRMPFVVMGNLASALALLHLYIWPEPWGAALLVLQIGIAQGVSTTPQSALVGEIGRRVLPDLSEGGIYGVFRLVERLGTAVGPLFVGLIWTLLSADAALAAMAAVITLGALGFALAWWRAPVSLKTGSATAGSVQ